MHLMSALPIATAAAAAAAAASAVSLRTVPADIADFTDSGIGQKFRSWEEQGNARVITRLPECAVINPGRCHGTTSRFSEIPERLPSVPVCSTSASEISVAGLERPENVTGFYTNVRERTGTVPECGEIVPVCFRTVKEFSEPIPGCSGNSAVSERFEAVPECSRTVSEFSKAIPGFSNPVTGCFPRIPSIFAAVPELSTTIPRHSEANPGHPAPPPFTHNPTDHSRCSFLGTIPGTGRILCGLAVLHDELYVARNFSSTIDVYDVIGDDFRSTPTNGIVVSGLRDPVDIATCKMGGAIYVSGSNDMSVFKVDARTRRAVGRWCLHTRPFGISVFERTGTVLVTFRDETIVREFTPDGAELRTLRLDPTQYSNPWHAVVCRLPRGESGGEEEDLGVVICHGWSKDLMNCVSLVRGSDEKLLSRFQGSGTDLPTHAAIDTRAGEVLVVELITNRVLRLSHPQMALPPGTEAVLLSEADGLKWPRSVVVDDVRRRLYVGLHDGPVLVFRYPCLLGS